MEKSQGRGWQTSRRNVLRLLAGVGLVPVLPRFARGRRGRVGRGGGDMGERRHGGDHDPASYPDPFTDPIDVCAFIASTTAGPCTTEDELLREDVSEGWTGLPVRLALRFVDTSCNPLSGVVVKIWHTNLEGSYSGETPNNGMCLKDQSYASSDFFRGSQTTDADGRVFFNTCFPGWYRGRAVHIHFQVKDGSQTYRISQLFFPEDVTEDIFATHSEYVGYGQPDTGFSNDNIVAAIPTAQRDRHILTVARMTDGVMLASKTVTVVDEVPATTPTPDPTATPTANATETPTGPTTASCVGDCNDDGSVGIDELVRGVNIALGDSAATSCAALDADGSGSVTIEELLRAVNAALSGCGTG